jgi:adenylate cyclase
MGHNQAERRLAAILSADVAGYSRLMAEDADATIRAVTARREQIELNVRQHRGRLVDFTGDNFLVEFGSAVEALECAVEIQRVLAALNAELFPERKMEFRMGLHLGEVRAQEGRLFGTGVNVAARLEGLAEPGGICISSEVHGQVENELDLGYEDLGEQSVKNIPKPVRVYRVRLDGGQSAAAQAPLHPLVPDKPSIVVLPFYNMSDDPEQEYFADGITEDLTNDLASAPDLFVIARNSAFTYKDKQVRVEQVGRELGVRYVLEGSVRWARDRVRVTAQLVDATTGRHVWSHRYDRELSDIFAIQAELAEEILTALPVQVREAELQRIQRRPTENLTAYEAFTRGTSHHNRQTRDDERRARQLFERAIELDPSYADAYWGLGVTLEAETGRTFGTGGDPKQREESLVRAEQAARRALELDAFNPRALTLLGYVTAEQGRLEEGLAAVARAAELAPSLAEPHTVLAALQARAGNLPTALQSATRAMRLDPRVGGGASLLGRIRYQAGRIDTGVMWLEQARAANPDDILTRVWLASHYEGVGRHGEASALVEELLRIEPDLTADAAAARTFFDAATAEQNTKNLRKAGLPDHVATAPLVDALIREGEAAE